MTLEIEDILRRVQRTEDDRADYCQLAEEWEDMWLLKAFDETPEMARKDGREQVTLPDPYNVVNLGLRMLSSRPSIVVPAEEVTEGKDEASEARQQFLVGVWQRSNHEQQRDLVLDGAWLAMVRGRGVFEVKWILEDIPKLQRKHRLPILLRTLDPLNVGIHRGPLGPMWAFHKWEESKDAVFQMYPDLEGKLDERQGMSGLDDEEDEVCIIDFWWIESDGAVWNAIVVEEEFAKSPAATDYPMIPIIEFYGDGAPIETETARGLAIYHPIREIWHQNCRLASQLATGLLWYYFPAITVMSPDGSTLPEGLKINPGDTIPLPPGAKIEVIQYNTNQQLGDRLVQMMEKATQESTFPSVMYGDPGSITAGYGINLLKDAAKGRIASVQKNLEWAMEQANMLILALVEVFAPEEGVALWGYNEGADKVVHIKLLKEQVSGYYENYVRITPNTPDDDVGRQTLGLRLVEQGIISRRTFQQKYLNISLPSDEFERIRLEQAQNSDEVKKLGLEEALSKYFGPTSAQIQAFSGVANGNGQGPPQPGGPPGGPPPGMPPGPTGPPAGMMPIGPPPGPPTGFPPGPPPMMPPPPGPPMGPPPPAGGMMPPPPGMPPGMLPPPPGLGGMMGPGGPPMPLGMGPPSGPPPMGLPPGPPPSPNPTLQPLGGMQQGLPPELQGGMSPETMGIPPELYQQLVNEGGVPVGPPTNEELLRMGNMMPRGRIPHRRF